MNLVKSIVAFFQAIDRALYLAEVGSDAMMPAHDGEAEKGDRTNAPQR